MKRNNKPGLSVKRAIAVTKWCTEQDVSSLESTRAPKAMSRVDARALEENCRYFKLKLSPKAEKRLQKLKESQETERFKAELRAVRRLHGI